MDLEKIQSQLKSHIRQHQVLVQEMKKDPQNVEIQRKVQSLQAELTSLNEKQKFVVQQLKQNIQTKPEANASEQLLQPSFSPHITVTGYNGQSSRSFASVPFIHHPVMNARVVENVSVPRLTSPVTAEMNIARNPAPFIPGHTVQSIRPPIMPRFHNNNASQNNIVNVNSEPVPTRPAFKKPMMITTGMQTLPSLKVDATRLKPILPRPESAKPKVSLGIQTSKPVEQVTKQDPAPKKSATGQGIKRGRGRPPKSSDDGLKSLSSVFSPVNGFKIPDTDALQNNKTSQRLSPAPSPKDEEHVDYCAVCQQSGEVLMCDTCILVYHLKCLSPPLTKIPAGMWMCPKCQETCKSKEPMEWPGTLAIAHSYLKHRAAKDKEKEKLLSRNQELKQQELELQRKVNELSGAIVSQIQRKNAVVESTRQTEVKLQRLKKFIDTVQSW